MADLMAPHQIDLNGALIVPIPTATQRVRQRGYDQSYLIARAFSRKTTAQFTPVLRRLGQQRQRGASKSTRAIQLSDAYWLRHYNFKNRHVVLVDDVVTTGATLESAARLLRAAGATRVEAIIFAKA
ncbi:hypothetical protein H7Y63_00950 [Polaromonas sp.]|nr:hypothetical protein [Candidatus Saccharibacteria bacterium]